MGGVPIRERNCWHAAELQRVGELLARRTGAGRGRAVDRDARIAPEAGVLDAVSGGSGRGCATAPGSSAGAFYARKWRWTL